MDKNTLGNYGWVVITVIIISIMIALANPFAVALKGNVVGVTNDFTGKLDAALNNIGNSAEGDEEEQLELNEYGFYFGQPYRYTEEYNGQKMIAEFIFYEDGSAFQVSYPENTENNTAAGCDFFDPGSFTYTANSVEGLATFSDNGTIMEFEGMQFVLTPVPQSSIQKERIYQNTFTYNGAPVTGTITFKNDGTAVRVNNINNAPGVVREEEVYAVECFDNYLILRNEESETIIRLYPDGTKLGSGALLYIIQ
jgi:hypothetical protein